jgi:hypothetical protein
MVVPTWVAVPGPTSAARTAAVLVLRPRVPPLQRRARVRGNPLAAMEHLDRGVDGTRLQRINRDMTGSDRARIVRTFAPHGCRSRKISRTFHIPHRQSEG